MCNIVRVIIADDHALVRQSMLWLLAQEPQIQIIAEAAEGRQALLLVEQLQPDVVVLDTVMPGLDGIRAAHQIRKAGYKTRVLMVSIHETYYLARLALKHGAHGYVAKSTMYQDLARAIIAVAQGEPFVSDPIREAPVGESLCL
ncbi:MAG: response regulator transcription factor [Caldilineaceae bacterium]